MLSRNLILYRRLLNRYLLLYETQHLRVRIMDTKKKKGLVSMSNMRVKKKGVKRDTYAQVNGQVCAMFLKLHPRFV